MPPGLVLHPPQLLVPMPGLNPGLPVHLCSPLGQDLLWGQSGTSDTAGVPNSCPGKFLAGSGEEVAGGQVDEGLQACG